MLCWRAPQPENVLVALDGHVKLADFGTVKHMVGRVGDNPPPEHCMTLIGSPEYMSPEMFRMERACETIDFWSLGCFGFELLAGVTPFAHGIDVNDTAALLNAILHLPIDLPRHVNVGPPEVEFIRALLVREPSGRLGARPHGHMAVLKHDWFAGVPPEAFLTKQVPCAQ